MQGNVIDSWVSDGTTHEISGILAAGAKYILHEVSAPDGYVVATDVEFIVDANGKVTEVTMLDDTTKLHVTKKDITGEKELAGAALEVKDTDGNIIDAGYLTAQSIRSLAFWRSERSTSSMKFLLPTAT